MRIFLSLLLALTASITFAKNRPFVSYSILTVELKSKEQIRVCAKTEEKSGFCFLTKFTTLLKPKSVVQMRFEGFESKQSKKVKKNEEMRVEIKAARLKSILELPVFEISAFSRHEEDSKTTSSKAKPYLEQHDPRTDYMLF